MFRKRTSGSLPSPTSASPTNESTNLKSRAKQPGATRACTIGHTISGATALAPTAGAISIRAVRAGCGVGGGFGRPFFHRRGPCGHVGLVSAETLPRELTCARCGSCRHVENGARIVNKIAFQEWLLGEHKVPS
jgi:hypothetical protein